MVFRAAPSFTSSNLSAWYFFGCDLDDGFASFAVLLLEPPTVHFAYPFDAPKLTPFALLAAVPAECRLLVDAFFFDSMLFFRHM